MTLQFLFEYCFPFMVALVIMLGIGLFQLIGLSTDAFDLDWLDADNDGHADNDLLAWLGVGTLPLSVVLVVLLATFATAGIAIQSFLKLPYLLAVPSAVGAAIAATGFIAPVMARFWPQDETTAVSLDHLLGKRGKVTTGDASTGHPAQVRVVDLYGQPHYVMMEPHHATLTIPEGAEVLLVSREGSTFRGLDPTGGFRTVE